MLHILSDKKRRSFYERNIDSIRNVLFENDVEDGYMFGFTENYVKVTAKYDPLRVNDIARVRIKEFSESGAMSVEEVEEVLTHHSA
jgi:threonylcarbamoyladenosine tRNA methylthiotransferase MtaB